MTTTFRSRLAIGLGAGLLVGAALGLLSAVTWEFEADRARVFFAFLFGGAIGGSILGVALPSIRTRTRAAAAGAWIATPVFLTLGMAVAPLRSYMGALLLVGLAVGAYAGVRLLPRIAGPFEQPSPLRLRRVRGPRFRRRNASE